MRKGCHYHPGAGQLPHRTNTGRATAACASVNASGLGGRLPTSSDVRCADAPTHPVLQQKLFGVAPACSRAQPASTSAECLQGQCIVVWVRGRAMSGLPSALLAKWATPFDHETAKLRAFREWTFDVMRDRHV